MVEIFNLTSRRDDSEILGYLKRLCHELDRTLDAMKDLAVKSVLSDRVKQQNSNDTCTPTDRKEELTEYKRKIKEALKRRIRWSGVHGMKNFSKK